MAKKSKTQRAKASAARQKRKAERERQEELESIEEAQPEAKEEAKKTLFKRSSSDSESKSTAKTGNEKAKEKKPKKQRFKFLHDVRSEMKRVTWPTRTDVLRWSGVVVGALVFFGVFVAILDNVVITPLLVLISGIGA